MLHLNALGSEERFASPPDVLLDQFLDYVREQFELVLEDLGAYQPSPPIGAEGPQLLPELTRPQSVFLVPSPAFQREALVRRQPGRRPQIVKRDALLAGVIREQATKLGRTVIEVDASLDPDRLVRTLETLFAAPLEQPRQLPDLSAMRHEENEVVHANLSAAGIPSFAYACECGRSGCTERLELTLEQFAASESVVAPVHAG
jgi:hypothetical protein